MFVSAARMSVAENLALITGKVTAAYSGAEPGLRAAASPRLVAVSKTKPVEMILEAYEAGHNVLLNAPLMLTCGWWGILRWFT